MRFPVADLDYETGVLRLEGAEGVVTEQISIPGKANVRRVRLDLDAKRFELGLPDGTTVAMDGPSADSAAEAELLLDRVVVYLDQNQWRALADWRSGAEGVTDATAHAATALSSLVDAERVVIALSGGNLIETSALYGDLREAVACTAVAFSRGWLMRSPFFVRHDELVESYEGRAPVAPRVFTLDPGEVFASATRRPGLRDGVPAEFRSLLERLIMSTSLIDILLDRERVPDQGGRAAVDSWLQGCADYASHMRDHDLSTDACRGWAHAYVLSDAIYEEGVGKMLGADLDRSKAWIDKSQSEVAAMPCLGRLRALLFARLRNGSSWKTSDFNDIHFLACAAGYATLVVGENRTVGDLRNAKHIPPGASLARTLPEAVATLADMGVVADI